MSQPPKSAKDIFVAALDVEPAERAAFLDDACAGDAALRRQVEALLRVHDEPDSFLDSPRIHLGLSGDDAGPGLAPTIDQPITEKPGTVIGPYKLLQKIGEGGFGVVYMADQTEPVKRRVALKIIKPGMDTRQIIARFEAERQALAMMDHPNIARVLDAGTTPSPPSPLPGGERGWGEGRPYFVMDLVKGVPITQYCDEHHLTPRQRLELFVPVCQAIQHAHQKGVIHRDIKPTNVLVAEYDDRAVPKIIDFGVAKATEQRLTEKTMFTQLGQVVGTIDYMSPEQAKLNELDIDTRSDIYSLGVLLYELLTGETPFDRRRLRSAAFDELLRIIREEEPPKPSLRLSTSESLPSIAANRHTEPKKLRTLVRGELDWIVMKALEKDRTRRYETANGFAGDIQRHLNNEPVVACPPSIVYRFRKFARRNRVALAVAAAILITLIAGLIGTSWMAVVARIERDRAAQQERMASDERDRARQAESRAHQGEQRALAAEAEITRTLFETNNSTAFIAAEQGKPAEAVLWFANAARYALKGSAQEIASRVRSMSWSRQTPIPVRMMWHDGEQLEAVLVNPRWDQVASLTVKHRCVIWDIFSSEYYEVPVNATSIDWAADGSLLAVGTEDGNVHLISPDSGRIVHTISFSAPITCVKYSLDGGLLAIASKVVRVWDTNKQSYAAPEWPHPETVRALTFSSDGRRLITGCEDDQARVYEIDEDSVGPIHDPVRHVLGMFEAQPPIVPQFVRGGRWYVTLQTIGEAVLHDAESGKRIEVIQLSPAIDSLQASPGGQLLAIVGHAPGGALLFDAESGESGSTVGNLKGSFRCVAFSRNQRWLLIANGGVKKWSVRDGESQSSNLTPGLGGVRHISIADDGRHFAAGTAKGLVCVWSMAERDLGRGLMLRGRGSGVKASRDGKYVVPTGAGWWWGTLKDTRVFSATDLMPQGRNIALDNLLLDASLSPDDRLLATATIKEIDLWDWRTGQRAFATVPLEVEPAAIDFAPTGKRLVVVCVDGSVQVLDTSIGEVIARARHGTGSPKQYSRYKLEKGVHAYRNSDGSAVSGPHQRYANYLRFSSDGAWFITSGIDQTVNVWSMADGASLHESLEHQGESFTDAVISDDDQYLATWNGPTILVWELRTGKPLSPKLVHSSGVRRVVFSPDGHQLLAACNDGTATLWDWMTNKPACPLMNHGGTLYDCNFVGDGEWLITVGGDSARFWCRHTGSLVSPPYTLTGHAKQLSVPAGGEWAFVSSGRSLGDPLPGRMIDAIHLGDLQSSDQLDCDALCCFAEVLSAKRISGGVAIPLSAREWRSRFEDLKEEHPELLERRLAAWYANASWRLSTAQNRAADDAAQALEYAHKALESEPHSARSWRSLGVAHYRVGNWKDAVSALERADRMLSGTGRGFDMFRAMSHWQIGDQQQARELYARGAAWIASHRRNDEAQNRFRAEAEELMAITEKDRERLVKEYRDRQIQDQPDMRSIVNWGHVGQALYRAGRYEEARVALEKVIELRADSGPTMHLGPRWWYYTMTLCRLGEFDPARTYFEQLVEEMKENPPGNKYDHLRTEAAELLGIEVEAEKQQP